MAQDFVHTDMETSEKKHKKSTPFLPGWISVHSSAEGKWQRTLSAEGKCPRRLAAHWNSYSSWRSICML
jgi:hypothetical protein